MDPKTPRPPGPPSDLPPRPPVAGKKERAPSAPQVSPRSTASRAWLGHVIAPILIVGSNLAVRQMPNPLHKLALYFALMCAFIFVRSLRAALGWTVPLLFVVAGGYYYSIHKIELHSGRIRAADAADGILTIATGIGPGDRGFELGALEDSPGAQFAKYVAKVDSHSSEINILAAHLASTCDSGDHLCETATLLRFVADEVAYRTDPRGTDDYIKSPQETLAANAGDCEDKTILLISLLESLGVRTYMVFTRSHAYPMACFDEPLTTVWEARQRTRSPSDLANYMRDLSPHHNPDEFLQLLKAAVEISIDGRSCYPLEPTAVGSWIGVDHGAGEYTIAVDPVTKKLVKVKAGPLDMR